MDGRVTQWLRAQAPSHTPFARRYRSNIQVKESRGEVGVVGDLLVELEVGVHHVLESVVGDRVEGQAGVLGPDPALVARGRRRLRGYGVLSRKGASQFVVAPQWMKFVRNGKAPGTCAKSKSSTAQAASVPAMP